MQRWQLTTLLAGGAVLAAVLAPQIRGALQGATNPPPPPQDLPPQPVPLQAGAQQDVIQSGALKIRAGLDHSAVLQGVAEERYVVITLQGDEIEPAEAPPPVNIAVVLDRSGSMGAKGKITYARQAARELVEALDADDRFALVAFSDRSRVLAPSAPVRHPDRLLAAIDAIDVGGGTNLYDGLNDGLDEVRDELSSESVNRVIVVSDGNANMGITSERELVELASSWNEQGISVSTMGVGLDYNEDLLAEMADWGGGSYRFIDAPAELGAVFQRELDQLSSLAARGVSVDLELAPGVQLLDVIGYSERTTADGARVWIGDVQSGETRKVIARVRVPAGSAGDTLPVVGLSIHHDAGDVALSLQATVGEDAQQIDASVDRELAVLATQAEASAMADEATRAFEEGDRAQMRSLMDASAQLTAEASERYNAPKLKDQSSALRRQALDFEQAAPASEEAYFQVKRAKEDLRAYNH